jgi:hypothetical protein
MGNGTEDVLIYDPLFPHEPPQHLINEVGLLFARILFNVKRPPPRSKTTEEERVQKVKKTPEETLEHQRENIKKLELFVAKHSKDRVVPSDESVRFLIGCLRLEGTTDEVNKTISEGFSKCKESFVKSYCIRFPEEDETDAHYAFRRIFRQTQLGIPQKEEPEASVKATEEAPEPAN